MRNKRALGLAVAAALVGLVLGVQLWPDPEFSGRRRAPNRGPASTPTTGDVDTSALCSNDPVGHVAGYLPEGFDSPNPRRADGAMPRWKGRKEATIELSRHRTPTDDLPDGHDVPIADTTGRLFQTEGGYALSFDEGGCSYIYEAVNVSRSEFRSFIANLSPAGNEFRATWPQPTLDAYRRACKSEGPPQTSDGPEAVVRGFFDEVVGTAIHKIAEEPEERGHGGRFYVVESTTGLDFDVLLSAHLTGCWSVTHVHAPGAPATWPLSVSIGNESPDLALVGGGSPPGSVSKVIEIGYGGRVHRGEAAAGGVLRTELPFSHNRSGYILVRYLDTDGDLQGFLATALPPGDFAAG